MKYTYKYPRPALTVDCVVFGYSAGNLKVLLIQRDNEPFAGMWALPGGFVNMKENLDDAARRELREETGISDLFLEQLYTFSAIKRDPRERVISVAYYAMVNQISHLPQAASDARNAAWFSLDNLSPLAFDHDEILKMALYRLRGKIRYQPLGFELLPEKFTLTQLQQLYESILSKTLDKRNFRKKIQGMGLLTELDETEQGVAYRAARLYQFDKEKYLELTGYGFNFEI